MPEPVRRTGNSAVVSAASTHGLGKAPHGWVALIQSPQGSR